MNFEEYCYRRQEKHYFPDCPTSCFREEDIPPEIRKQVKDFLNKQNLKKFNLNNCLADKLTKLLKEYPSLVECFRRIYCTKKVD